MIHNIYNLEITVQHLNYFLHSFNIFPIRFFKNVQHRIQDLLTFLKKETCPNTVWDSLNWTFSKRRNLECRNSRRFQYLTLQRCLVTANASQVCVIY